MRDRRSAGKAVDHWEPLGSPYLTDGVNLFRYIGGGPDSRGELIAFEDCRSFDIVLFTLDDLTALRSVDTGADQPRTVGITPTPR